MIRIAQPLLDQITAAAEAAYPLECCGLLTGRGAVGGALEVLRVVPSANLAAGDRRDSFEVDPQVRFDLMRELGEIGDAAPGDERIIGHYHSHPDHPAEPSARDLEMAFEPDMVWIIVGVDDGLAGVVTAHVVDPAGPAFREIPLHT